MGENQSIIPSLLLKKRKGPDPVLIYDPNGVEQEEIMEPMDGPSVKDHLEKFLRLIREEQWIH